MAFPLPNRPLSPLYIPIYHILMMIYKKSETPLLLKEKRIKTLSQRSCSSIQPYAVCSAVQLPYTDKMQAMPLKQRLLITKENAQKGHLIPFLYNSIYFSTECPRLSSKSGLFSNLGEDLISLSTSPTLPFSTTVPNFTALSVLPPVL